MSPELSAEFEAAWPELARRLRLLLARKRVPPGDVDDLIQETCLRLLRVWHDVDRDRPAWPLTATIALNLLRDRARTRRPESLDASTVLVRCDVEDAGIARAELDRVADALLALSPSQRAAVLAPLIGDGPDTPSVKMMRSRARRRLRQMLERASVLGVLRRSGVAEMLQVVGRTREQMLSVACGVVALVVGVPFGAAPAPAAASSLPPRVQEATVAPSPVAQDVPRSGGEVTLVRSARAGDRDASAASAGRGRPRTSAASAEGSGVPLPLHAVSPQLGQIVAGPGDPDAGPPTVPAAPTPRVAAPAAPVRMPVEVPLGVTEVAAL